MITSSRSESQSSSRRLSSLRRMVLLVLAALLVPGCGGATGPSGSATGTTSNQAAAGEPWDLLYISDSSGWYVADLYAQPSKALGAFKGKPRGGVDPTTWTRGTTPSTS